MGTFIEYCKEYGLDPRCPNAQEQYQIVADYLSAKGAVQ
jgi:hypothetical protein